MKKLSLLALIIIASACSFTPNQESLSDSTLNTPVVRTVDSTYVDGWIMVSKTYKVGDTTFRKDSLLLEDRGLSADTLYYTTIQNGKETVLINR
jgi:hypothetical protein